MTGPRKDFCDSNYTAEEPWIAVAARVLVLLAFLASAVTLIFGR